MPANRHLCDRARALGKAGSGPPRDRRRIPPEAGWNKHCLWTPACKPAIALNRLQSHLVRRAPAGAGAGPRLVVRTAASWIARNAVVARHAAAVRLGGRIPAAAARQHAREPPPE